jgi:serine/threonine protein kinase
MDRSEHLPSLPSDLAAIESASEVRPSTAGIPPSTAGRSAETDPAHVGVSSRVASIAPAASAAVDHSKREPPSQPTDDSPLTGVVLGDVTIERLIARGGMSHVYRGFQRSVNRVVAVKFTTSSETPLAARRFQREVQLLGQLSHPHIASLFDTGELTYASAVVPYFVMEYVPDAESLVEFCDRRQLATHERLRFFLDACDAIAAGHDQGIVHRDIKPDNLLIAPLPDTTTNASLPDGHAIGCLKVIDFGIATAISPDQETANTSASRQALQGTRPYMSPEQFAGDGTRVGTASDVYSLGVVLHALLTGDLPYDLRGQSLAEAARTVQQTPARPLRLPPHTLDRSTYRDLRRLLAACLAKEPQERYAHAGLLAADVRRLLAGQPLAHLPDVPRGIRLLGRSLRFPRAAACLLFAVALITISTGIWLAQRSDRDRLPPSASTVEPTPSRLKWVGISPDYPNASHAKGADPALIPQRISPLQWVKLLFDPEVDIPNLEHSLTPDNFQITRNGQPVDTSGLSLEFFDRGSIYSCIVKQMEPLTTAEGHYTLAIKEPLPPNSSMEQQPVTTPLYAWEMPFFSRFRFDLHDADWDRRVVAMSGLSQTTVDMFSGTSFTFLRPQAPNVEAEVVMRFPVDFPVQIAWLRVRHAVWATIARPFAQRNTQQLREENEPAPFDPGASVTIDVSTDGENWTTITGLTFGHAGISFNPLNISDLVRDSHEVWVRARIYGTRTWSDEGVIFSQLFVTTPESDQPAFELDLTGTLPTQEHR